MPHISKTYPTYCIADIARIHRHECHLKYLCNTLVSKYFWFCASSFFSVYLNNYFIGHRPSTDSSISSIIAQYLASNVFPSRPLYCFGGRRSQMAHFRQPEVANSAPPARQSAYRPGRTIHRLLQLWCFGQFSHEILPLPSGKAAAYHLKTKEHKLSARLMFQHTDFDNGNVHKCHLYQK